MCSALLLLVLLAPALMSGCQSASASPEVTPPPVLWSQSDAREALESLRSLRKSQSLIAATHDTTLESAGQIAEIDRSQHIIIERLEGLEQRLDHQGAVSAGSPPAVGGTAPAASNPPGSDNPLCVTIDGVDTDLPAYLATWSRYPVQYEGPSDRDGLVAHLADHGIVAADKLTIDQMQLLHAARHVQETEQGIPDPVAKSALAVGDDIQLFGPRPNTVIVTPPAPPEPQTDPNCINGQCVNGTCRYRTRTVSVSTPTQSTSSTRTVGVQNGQVYRSVSASSTGYCSGPACRQAMRRARRGW